MSMAYTWVRYICNIAYADDCDHTRPRTLFTADVTPKDKERNQNTLSAVLEGLTGLSTADAKRVAVIKEKTTAITVMLMCRDESCR